jgi:dTDP-glucose 4,6-dehydratase
MKRVLLTGAAGFVGSHVLANILENTDWDIIIPFSMRHKGNPSRLAQVIVGNDAVYTKRLHGMYHDLRVPFSKQEVELLGNIDYIINMASESHVDRSIDEPRDFIENNIALMLTMLDYAREHPVEKFLQISTDEVFGAAKPKQNHPEGSPHLPSNPYSASKAAQEDIAVSYWRTYGVPVIITNTMNIIGEMQDPEKLVPRTIQCILNDETMPIYGSPDGKFGTRKYLHARNQADALQFILDKVDAVMYSSTVDDLERINIVGDTELNNLEMANTIAAAVGKVLNYEVVDFHSSRPGHNLRYSLDGTKLAKLGWTAPISFEDSIARTVKFYVDNPEWLL